MTNIPEWKITNGEPYAVTTVKSWREYIALIETDFLDWPEYIFRGQGDAQWSLRPTFDRELRKFRCNLNKHEPGQNLSKNLHLKGQQSQQENELEPRQNILSNHLERFQAACSGRRGTTPKQLTQDEWWALGQHYGLATPLLDWSQSPHVACFFALQNSVSSKSGMRALWVFSHIGFVETLINMEENLAKPNHDIASIECLRTRIDENHRLTSQGGLFTRTPSGEDIEEFIQTHLCLQGMSPILYRIDIPETLRESFLRHFAAMNIHAGTLFPDLAGAVEFSNRGLEREYSDILWKQEPDFIDRMLSKNIAHD